MSTRKKWVFKSETTPSLLKFREKRKWQIALRRYILEKNPCSFYAPYFGLDIENIRKWIEIQFDKDLNWENFGKEWQFDHIIPVTYFDFGNDEELRLCWNFINVRVEKFDGNKNRGNRLDIIAAKSFFIDLYEKTQYLPSLKLVEKITRIELSELTSTKSQKDFISEKKDYLDIISSYSSFEFDLLNNGRSLSEVQKEISFFKTFE
ncbi:MAG TPA: hypothetical protein VGQ09_14590 [Chitinophagaceae bacterium]|jgi:hypothetical protein|nr:hypothetical protein [Chitinophagaceae bacterium]